MKSQNQAAESRLGQEIKNAGSSGRLALIVCVIPGLPNERQYAEMLAYFEEQDEITLLEFTYPATKSFSETANDTIVQANLKSSEIVTDTSLPSLFKTQKTSFVMFYRDTVNKIGFENLLRQNSELFRGVMLEWRGEDTAPYREKCIRAGMELIQTVPVGMSDEEIRITVELCDPGGLVYVSCAPKAGGPKPPASEISACVQRIKELRPDTVITTALGIKTPQDVQEMSEIAGVDAVVMGTSFIQAAQEGLPSVVTLFNQISPSLRIR